MSIDQFWSLIERGHAAAPNDMQQKCRKLKSELESVSLDELLSFGKHFDDLLSRAYTWDLWGAACVICDGCGDDSFSDFRSTLISLGSTPYNAGLTHADSLAEFDIDPEWACFEGFQYVAFKVYEEREGSLPELEETRPAHPREPAGIPFKEWKMTQRFPKLVAKYGYKDEDWLSEKIRQDKARKAWQDAVRLANFLIASGIIAKNGMIPPVEIVRTVVRTGKSPNSVRAFTWEPFELDLDDFWPAVSYLENMSHEDPGQPAFKLDVGVPDATTYRQWVTSLMDRRLI